MSKILTDSDVILMVGGATTRCRPLRAYSLLRTAMDRARVSRLEPTVYIRSCEMCFRTHTLHLTFSECTGLLYLYMEDTLVVIQEEAVCGALER